MKLQVKPQFAGRTAPCPTCKHRLVVPALNQTPAPVVAGQIPGTASSLAQADVDAGVTLDQAALTKRTGQKPVQELLKRPAGPRERYCIDQEIARGGMGVVLRAVDCDVRREVAVKYLLDQNDRKKKLRFIEEAQITGQLEHPNIVPIHELGMDAQKRLFFSMKMVHGRSLAQVVEDLRNIPRAAEKEWPLTRLLTIFVNICHALAYAHSRSVVHRDLKPANIMVGDFGEVYVMDWGLAKVLGGGAETSASDSFTGPRSSKVMLSPEVDTDLTQVGTILGTPAYMPPEQATGQINLIDQRSDVYSLGAILYEMLTLEAPVSRDGGYVSILVRVAEGTIVPPEQRDVKRARAGKIPRELAAIAMKALAKEPQDRYQDVMALRRDVECFHEGRSVSAKQDTTREMFWKMVKRNKALSAATFLFLALLLVAFGYGFKNYLAFKKAQDEKDARSREAVPAFVAAARLLAERNQPDDALKQLSVALAYDATNADARLLKGQLMLARRDFAGARAELEQYARVRPMDQDAAELLKLCAGHPDDPTRIQAIAEVFARQRLFSLAEGLSQSADQNLSVYRARIKTAWPGLEKNLTREGNGQYKLTIPDHKEINSLAALQGMPLHILDIHNDDAIWDLTPLKGMPLTSLNIQGCALVKDLKPLQGMPLTTLSLSGCSQVRDLAPLQGMPLTTLSLTSCSLIQDLRPLRGMKLTSLHLTSCTRVRDLAPLQGMPLTTLDLNACTLIPELKLLQGMPLTSLTLSSCTQIQDLKPLEGMPLTTLLLASCKQIRDLTPLHSMKLTKLNLDSWEIQDLTPLKGLALVELSLNGCTKVSDLTPLKGMPIRDLRLTDCGLVHDLTPLAGMPLQKLYLDKGNQVRDVTPLKGMSLTEIRIVAKNITKGMDLLRSMKSLTSINSMSAEEFWRKYDAGEFSK
jgi:serine/threonine protein kinase